MKILFSVVTIIALVGCGGGSSNPVYSDIPLPGSGSNGRGSSGSDGGTKQQTTKVCGVPGNRQKAGFSYLHCRLGQEDDSISGTTYTDRSVAVGGDAIIYIDSPFIDVGNATSSDESIAHFKLINVTDPFGQAVRVDAKRSGSVTLTILSGKQVIDDITVDIRTPTQLSLHDTLYGRSLSTSDEVVGFLNPLSFPLCAASSDGSRDLEGRGLIQLSSEGAIGITPNEYACDERWGGPQGDGSTIAIGAAGATLTATMGTVVKTLHFVKLEPEDITVALSIAPKNGHLPRNTSDALFVYFSAGPLPVLDGACEFSSAPAGLDFGTCSDNNHFCSVSAKPAAPAGRYLVNCTVAGRIVSSIPVVVD